MIKKTLVLKIVKEDILRILSERSESTSLETIKNGIKAAQSIISESLEELKKDKLLTIQKNLVSLTERGQAEAETISKKHIVLEDYFRKTRGDTEAHKAAHIIEHYISGKVINNIKKLSTLKKEGVPLTRFRLNKKGLISEIMFSDYKLFERAISMGLFPGENVSVIGSISSAIILKVGNKKFALDRSIAKGIKALEYEKV